MDWDWARKRELRHFIVLLKENTLSGTASTGRRLAVVFVIVPDPDDVLIYPITAYPVED